MDEIFRTHLDAIYNYCYRRSGSWSTAEDLTSAVFLEVWKTRRRAIELDGSVLPWLYGVATNVCRNHQRSQRRGEAALAKLHLADVSPEQVDRDVVEQLDADRRLARVLEQLRELPQTEQDVFVLVCWEDLSYAQTAQALNIPIGTVRSRLARVRRILRLTDDLESSDV
jgi:RNA polymerase sigma factor (sigma-70 family)